LSRRCPKCGKEIDYLYYYAYELQKATFYISSNNHAEYSNWDSIPDIKGDPEYVCPECGEVLFTSEEEAEKFLGNEETE
jgi:predicted RNA-binding Zn-ribbon protein involved in translation (DUF1610 family)